MRTQGRQPGQWNGKISCEPPFLGLGVLAPRRIRQGIRRPANTSANMRAKSPEGQSPLRSARMSEPYRTSPSVIRHAKPSFRTSVIRLRATLPAGKAKVKSLTCIFYRNRILFGGGTKKTGREKILSSCMGTMGTSPFNARFYDASPFPAGITRSRWAWAGQPFCRLPYRGRRGRVRTLLSACSRCSWTGCAP